MDSISSKKNDIIRPKQRCLSPTNQFLMYETKLLVYAVGSSFRLAIRVINI